MARYRRIPTTIRSERDLARALGEMGLKHVEVHAEPMPLSDWIGRPTDVQAQVIVRRKDLGASYDDFGFVRTPNGTFEMLLSDMHLFRFDRRFVEDLARRTGTAGVPSGPVQYATSSSPSTAESGHGRLAAERPPPRDQNVEHRARIEAAEILDTTKRGQRLGRLGCLLFFLPVVPWFLLEQVPELATGPGGLVTMMIAWGLLYFVVVSIVLTVRLGHAARKFHQRFTSREARAAATAQLRSIAEDKKHAGADVARRLLRQVEAQGTRVVMPRPPTASRAANEKAER